MFRVILVIAALPMLFPSLAVAEQAYNRPTVVMVLPAQANSQSQRLAHWLTRDPAFANVRAQYQVQSFAPGNALYEARYSQSLPITEAPTVAVCDQLGRVFYKASRTTLPAMGSTLAQSITSAIDRSSESREQIGDEWGGSCPDGNCPDGRCPNRQPCPDGNCPLDPSTTGPLADTPVDAFPGATAVVVVAGALIGFAIVAVVAIFVLLLVKHFLVRK